MTEIVKNHEMIIETDERMRELGRRIGEALFPSAFVAFFGDLGAGKTTMVKGIADALGIEGISSPTFTIVRRHEGRLRLDHFDAYRIESANELTAIGFDDFIASEDVIVMEWCENVQDALPEERLEIHLEGSGCDPRKVVFYAIGQKYCDLLEAVIC